VGQQVMVQVVKDPMGTKGARVTTEVTFPGRFLVLMPYSDFVGVSKKLADAERDRLHEVIDSHVPAGTGVIVRTAAQGATDKDLINDLEFLLRLWRRVSHQSTEALAPEIIYTEMDLALRLVRDVFSDEFRRMVIDDRSTYEKVVSFLKKTSPELVKRIQLYRDREPLFDSYGFQDTIDTALRRTVMLPSGGHLTIDKTEALTAIDVNTGKFVGKRNLDETILKTNLEAAEEAVRQIRLRDLGGIIVIDFIDMEPVEHRQLVTRRLASALEADRTKTRMGEMSRLNLVELTRKNVTDGLYGVLTERCPHCDGEGRIVSRQTRLIAVQRRLRQILKSGSSESYLFGLNPETLRLVNEPGVNLVASLKAETGKGVTIVADETAEATEVKVLIEGGRPGLWTKRPFSR